MSPVQPSPATHTVAAPTSVDAARGERLTKVYGAGETRVVALDAVDVAFPRGVFTAIMGPSGSGKSTLMHCMAGLDAVDGRAWIGDAEISALDDKALTLLRRDRVGFVFQAFNLLPTLTALEQRATAYGGRLHAPPARRRLRRHGVPAAAGRRMSVRVLLVDDQPMLRTGFRLILSAENDIEVVGEAADGAVAVAQAQSLRPDVVLMDIRMPAMDGIEATRRVVVANDPPKVLVLNTFGLDEYVVEALRAGASGFLLKDAPADDLVDAVRIVHRGEAVVAPRVTRRLLDRFASRLPTTAPGQVDRLPELTDREREVLLLVARGLSNAEIAAELVVSETTVKTHVSSVLLKLGLRDRVQAVVLAYESGLVKPAG